MRTVLRALFVSAIGASVLGGCAANHVGTAEKSEAPVVWQAPRSNVVTTSGTGTITISMAEMNDAKGRTLSGKVQSFNMGPRGEVEGAMVMADGKLTQLNFPPGVGAAVMGSVKVGDTVTAAVSGRDDGPRPGMMRGGRGPDGRRGMDGPRDGRGPERVKADHPVFDVESVTDAKGKTYGMTRGDDRKAVHVEGKVAAVNYDRVGMANGVQLDSGELVSLTPEAAKVLSLAVGSKVTVDGVAAPTMSGGKSIDAHTVNGIVVKELGGDNREDGPRMRGPGGESRGRGPMMGGRGGPPMMRDGMKPKDKAGRDGPDGDGMHGKDGRGPKGDGAKPGDGKRGGSDDDDRRGKGRGRPDRDGDDGGPEMED